MLQALGRPGRGPLAGFLAWDPPAGEASKSARRRSAAAPASLPGPWPWVTAMQLEWRRDDALAASSGYSAGACHAADSEARARSGNSTG